MPNDAQFRLMDVLRLMACHPALISTSPAERYEIDGNLASHGSPPQRVIRSPGSTPAQFSSRAAISRTTSSIDTGCA